ncbi:MAG: restriction endonuclease [Eubacteriaceae bacterium]|nr:restriction endonuclease [Eubacteriaceae bacterium]
MAALAKEHGISDIFQDNGAKTLQQLIYLNMKLLPGREGNDSISESGTEWEMKSINLETSAKGFSTNHHTNHYIISKYRKVPWTFSIYYGITLSEIYIMKPEMMEPIYSKWEEKLKTMNHLNNPKIPVSFVRTNGLMAFPINMDAPFDPDSINRI